VQDTVLSTNVEFAESESDVRCNISECSEINNDTCEIGENVSVDTSVLVSKDICDSQEETDMDNSISSLEADMDSHTTTEAGADGEREYPVMTSIPIGYQQPVVHVSLNTSETVVSGPVMLGMCTSMDANSYALDSLQEPGTAQPYQWSSQREKQQSGLDHSVNMGNGNLDLTMQELFHKLDCLVDSFTGLIMDRT
jgi:hypothetical protein